MKKIHSTIQNVQAKCSCGNEFNFNSAKSENIHLDACSNCHPAFTGVKKTLDTAGQVEKFKARMQKAQEMKK